MWNMTFIGVNINSQKVGNGMNTNSKGNKICAVKIGLIITIKMSMWNCSSLAKKTRKKKKDSLTNSWPNIAIYYTATVGADTGCSVPDSICRSQILHSPVFGGKMYTNTRHVHSKAGLTVTSRFPTWKQLCWHFWGVFLRPTSEESSGK